MRQSLVTGTTQRVHVRDLASGWRGSWRSLRKPTRAGVHLGGIRDFHSKLALQGRRFPSLLPSRSTGLRRSAWLVLLLVAPEVCRICDRLSSAVRSVGKRRFIGASWSR